jgi:hypothetical protein
MVLNEQTLREMVLEALEELTEEEQLKESDPFAWKSLNQLAEPYTPNLGPEEIPPRTKTKTKKKPTKKKPTKKKPTKKKPTKKTTTKKPKPKPKSKPIKKAAKKTVKKAAEKAGGKAVKDMSKSTVKKKFGRVISKKGGAEVIKTGVKQATKQAIFKQGAKMAVKRAVVASAASLASGPAAPFISGAFWAMTAVDIVLLAMMAYGMSDDPEGAVKALEQDKAKKLKDRYQVVVQGPSGNEEKWFKSQKKRREWMACYKKRGGGDINFDVNAPPCGTATADPAAKPKVKARRRRRGRFPAGLKYKSYDEFYQAIDATKGRRIYDRLVKALGRRDHTWGPKHRKAYKMLASLKMRGADVSGGFRELPDGTRVYDDHERKPGGQMAGIQEPTLYCPDGYEPVKEKRPGGKTHCMKKSEGFGDDESLASIKNDPKALGWPGNRERQWESKESVKTLLADEKYERLLEQLLKENV